MSVPPKIADPFPSANHPLSSLADTALKARGGRLRSSSARLEGRIAEQVEWVRALARRLVREPAAAEDVAQETLLAALATPPRDVEDGRRLRAWLGKVTHNQAHLATRRNMRRRWREECVARQERVGSAAEGVVRSSVTLQLERAVQDLDPTSRRVVQLRYFESVPIAEISGQLGISENAVRKRLWRARKQLRSRLEGVHNGEKAAWFSAFLPWLGLDRLGSSAWSGLPTGAKLGAAGALAAASLGLLATVTADAPVPKERVAAMGALAPSVEQYEVARAPRTPLEAAAREESVGHRAPVGPIVDPLREESAEAPTATLRGRVVDLTGRGVSGVGLVAPGRSGLSTVSGPEGHYELAYPGERPALQLGDSRYFELGSSGVGSETTWIVAPSVRAAGLCVDGDGLPLREVSLELRIADRAFVRLDLPVRLGVEARRGASDGSGGFDLTLPRAEGISLVFARPGFETRSLETQALTAGMKVTLLGERTPLALEADPLAPVARSTGRALGAEGDQGLLRGRLLSEGGEPLESWRIAAVPVDPSGVPETYRAGLQAQTDGRGAFEFRGKLGASMLLVAAAPDEREFMESGPHRLGGKAIELRWSPRVPVVQPASGRVVDARGRPVAGASVEVMLRVAGGLAGVSTPWSVLTDGDGRYELPEVPSEAILVVEAPGKESLRLAGGLDAEALLQDEGYLALEGFGGEAFGVLDADGAPLELRGPVSRGLRVPVEGGRTPLYAVEGEAHTLVLEVGGLEVHRPLELRPGELLRLQP